MNSPHKIKIESVVYMCFIRDNIHLNLQVNNEDMDVINIFTDNNDWLWVFLAT